MTFDDVPRTLKVHLVSLFYALMVLVFIYFCLIITSITGKSKARGI
jgi:hypothetical protein